MWVNFCGFIIKISFYIANMKLLTVMLSRRKISLMGKKKFPPARNGSVVVVMQMPNWVCYSSKKYPGCSCGSRGQTLFLLTSATGGNCQETREEGSGGGKGKKAGRGSKKLPT